MSMIYISGKITDLPIDEVSKKFESAKHQLIADGVCVVSPLDLPHDHDKSWQSYMLENLKALTECDSIFMLKCWSDSPGARIEHDFALRMGIRILYENI